MTNESKKDGGWLGCLIIIGVVVLLFVLAQIIAPYDPSKRNEYRPPPMGGPWGPGEGP